MTLERFQRRRDRLTAPRAAAIAGIVFSLLFITSLGLFLVALPTTQGTAANAADLNLHRPLLILGLNLVPFAGIAFLWFMGVVRDRLGFEEDQFFATVFLGSGLLFVAMLFTSTAVMGSLLTIYTDDATPQTATIYYTMGRSFAQEIVTTYGIKIAGVFMISTCTLFLRTGVLPRWMSFMGYGLALTMLFRIGHIDRLGWIVVLLPLWILLISIYVLIDNYRQKNDLTDASEMDRNGSEWIDPHTPPE